MSIRMESGHESAKAKVRFPTPLSKLQVHQLITKAIKRPHAQRLNSCKLRYRYHV